MTTAAENAQHPSADAGGPPEAGSMRVPPVPSEGLTLLGAFDENAVGMCSGGVCRLPGARD